MQNIQNKCFKKLQNLEENVYYKNSDVCLVVWWNAGMVMPGQIISLYENYMFHPNYGIQHYVPRPGDGWCPGLPHD